MFLSAKSGAKVEDTFQYKVCTTLGLPESFSPLFDPLIACTTYIPFFLVVVYVFAAGLLCASATVSSARDRTSVRASPLAHAHFA